ncbi:hypothetical protein JB92DRAFT_3114042 [Gautieria morchelliformis]|nr:hypothetical protein JB92DRAFT_3114042 [Gautieria morchelliformis]
MRDPRECFVAHSRHVFSLYRRTQNQPNLKPLFLVPLQPQKSNTKPPPQKFTGAGSVCGVKKSRSPSFARNASIDGCVYTPHSGLVPNRALRDLRRDEHGRHAHAEVCEVERERQRIERDLGGRQVVPRGHADGRRTWSAKPPCSSKVRMKRVSSHCGDACFVDGLDEDFAPPYPALQPAPRLRPHPRHPLRVPHPPQRRRRRPKPRRHRREHGALQPLPPVLPGPAYLAKEAMQASSAGSRSPSRPPTSPATESMQFYNENDLGQFEEFEHFL